MKRFESQSDVLRSTYTVCSFYYIRVNKGLKS